MVQYAKILPVLILDTSFLKYLSQKITNYQKMSYFMGKTLDKTAICKLVEERSDLYGSERL